MLFNDFFISLYVPSNILPQPKRKSVSPENNKLFLVIGLGNSLIVLLSVNEICSLKDLRGKYQERYATHSSVEG